LFRIILCRRVGSFPPVFSVFQVERRIKCNVEFEAKYHYVFWRPITAIPLADSDGNPATIADPNWTPLIITPAHPDYPSGHSTLTAAAIVVLAHYFGKDSSIVVDSEVSPGVVRSFSDFASAQVELNNARVYGGIHFRTACDDGQATGTAVARFLLNPCVELHHGSETRVRDGRRASIGSSLLS
jgi:hypothetical protein